MTQLQQDRVQLAEDLAGKRFPGTTRDEFISWLEERLRDARLEEETPLSGGEDFDLRKLPGHACSIGLETLLRVELKARLQ